MRKQVIVLGAICAAALGWVTWLVYAGLQPSAKGAPDVASAAAAPDQEENVRSTARARVVSPRASSASELQRMRGIVRDRSGRGIATATVCWSHRLRECCEPSQCTRVDAEGRFEVQADAADPRWLVASAPDYASATHQILTESAAPIALILAARSGSGLSGHVLDASGGPVAGAAVSARSESEPIIVSNVLTNSAGHFNLDATAGDWLLTARSDGYAPSYLRSSAPTRDLTLLLAPGSSIQGRVESESVGDPVPGALVQLVGASGAIVPVELSTTDELGRFTFNSLGPGSYQLQVRSPGWRSDSMSVALGMADSADVVITASTAGSLRGIIRFGEATCESGRLLLDGFESLLADTSPGGAVAIDGILPGSYAATVECVGGAPLRERIEVGAKPVHREWQLLAGLVLAGSVLDASGHPLAGAQVVVLPSEQSLAPSQGASGEHDRDLAVHTTSSCESDTSGEFRCSGLVPGDYRCGLVGADQSMSATAVSVTLAPDSPTHVVLRAPAQGTLRVSVAGKGASSLRVFVTSPKKPLPVAGSKVGTSWVFAPLELGEYRVFLGDPAEPAVPPTSVRLSNSGEVLDVELTPPALLAVSGSLVTDQGDPVADAMVEIVSRQHGEHGASATIFSDVQGRFVVDDLLPGRYSVVARSPMGEVTAPDVVAGTAALTLRIPRYGALSGSARFRRGNGGPFFLHHLRLGSDDGDVAVPVAASDWRLPRLVPGHYRLQARSRTHSSESFEVTVEPGTEGHVELELQAMDASNLAAVDPAGESGAAEEPVSAAEPTTIEGEQAAPAAPL